MSRFGLYSHADDAPPKRSWPVLRVLAWGLLWAAMLFWALLASGQINMRKVDGWQTLATKPIDQPIDLAA